MLVSHRKQFIFIKSAKTAGTSVEEYFERWCLPEGAYQPSQGRPAEITAQGVIGARHKRYHATSGGFTSHLSAEGIREKVGPEIWNRYFKFTCIRNPYDKVVSWFHMRMPKDDRDRLGERDFAETREMFRNWLIIFPSTPNDEMYTSIRGDIIIDGVIRYERLLEDIEAVCREEAEIQQPDFEESAPVISPAQVGPEVATHPVKGPSGDRRPPPSQSLLERKLNNITL